MPRHIILKSLNTQNKERILKAAREKLEVTYKGKPTRVTADFSTKTLKTRWSWNDVFQAVKTNS
jgi:hypothetical protein